METPINELDFKLYIVTVDTEDGRFEYEYASLKQARERLDKEEQGFISGLKDDCFYSIDQKIKQTDYTNKKIELIQDASDKVAVSIEADKLHAELMAYFKWRKDSKDLNKVIKRFKGLGTYEHDKFIKHLESIGY